MNKHCWIAVVGVFLLLSPRLGTAETYKVFKGDGFSFRYPVDWEEGLPQANTTRALVRAISSRTGYAASCNVNVSFVAGLDRFTQAQINEVNHRLHDIKYLSRIESMLPDVKILDYNTNTYLSFQPASSVEYTGVVKTHNASQTNRFFQIMTIRKPNRYVVTCRGEPANFLKAREARELIVSTFGIFQDIDNP
jgi:hypothetical protein